MFRLYWIDFRSVPEIDPLQCGQCSETFSRTSPELSCSHRNGVMVWQRKPCLKSKRMITKYHSKNRADPMNSQFTLGEECSKKLSNTERITFGIRAFQVIIITRIVPDQLSKYEYGYVHTVPDSETERRRKCTG